MSFQLRTLVLGSNGQYFTIAHVDLNVLSVNFEKSKWSVKCPADFGNQVLTNFSLNVGLEKQANAGCWKNHLHGTLESVSNTRPITLQSVSCVQQESAPRFWSTFPSGGRLALAIL